ncbi:MULTISPECIES: urea ABC transporter ATP-binding protein UrtD [Methylorubrum]|uniref:ABC transporter related n=2 Tax=Methylorubrum TaxID=2282523 RepID=B1ZCU5_METPB|nr:MULTISPECIES: urea ABC transporter ATP-binding protein UrtD [Methylorubrum]ACB79457.1 ABC transporter related [Methylorubrum populi BJ001]MBA8913833.1 urea transport system ATP-binding protein [Methylorubrum thiocyanatum]PZP65891.1 MAG: urea ABC transporter ATP-binding protein UrtD [Methylorubrum populi]QDI80150.1 urea ABC transporter ATP-binding protein UrtD [Methylorubrum populi]GJE82564.1 Lipopolysaccharide export system ATP-binding protein LptB [Methylorubrum thiocyanatum]
MGVLEIRDLHKSFGGTKVINGFSLDVTELTLCCLVGPNGAGKTTTMDLITGRQKPTSGSIVLRGDDITSLSEHEIAQRGIGRKFQVPAVFRELSVRQNFEVAYSREVNPFRNMLRRRPAGFSAKLDEVATLTGLKDRLDVEAGFLSHGETQWLEIGMVLMQNPAILLLDEPVAGMTESEIEKTIVFLNELKRTNTLIVVEHDMGFVRQIADVVTVMHMGAFLAQGKLSDIENDPRVREVYLGEPEV